VIGGMIPGMITVGLTGGIACGKSTVAGMIRAAGVPVLDMDQVSRTVMAPGAPLVDEIGARWPQVVAPDGAGRLAVDRKALGAVIVADPAAKQELERLVHPRVWAWSGAWLAEQQAAGSAVAVVEAALMIETGSWRRFDRLLVVSCDPAVQRSRLRAREGYSEEQADRWLAAQWPVAEKERVAEEAGGAGAVIRNDSDEGNPARAGALSGALRAAWRRLGLPDLPEGQG